MKKVFDPEKFERDCAAVLTELIQRPSESTGATATAAPPEGAVAAYVEHVSAAHGIPCTSQTVGSGRANRLLRLPAPNRPRMLITAHMDTVGAGGMDAPFAGRLRDGRIHGRGACDDKGSLAVLLTLLPWLKALGEDLRYDLTIACTVAEEQTMAGAGALARATPGGWDLCLAMEPSGLRPITCHIGVYRARLVPHDGGIAACRALARDLEAVRAKVEADTHPALGRAQVTITVIEGSATTPHRVLVDARVLPHHSPAAIHRQVGAVAGDRARIIPLYTGLGIDEDPGQPMIRAFCRAIKDLGADVRPLAVPWPSECSLLRGRGPCLVWGPGNPRLAHQPNESIATSDLRRAGEILFAFLATAP